MELLPLGPVLFVDTAGVDDEGALGELRMARTRAVLDRVDLGVIVTERGAWGEFEAGCWRSCRRARCRPWWCATRPTWAAGRPDGCHEASARWR